MLEFIWDAMANVYRVYDHDRNMWHEETYFLRKNLKRNRFKWTSVPLT